MSEVSRPPRWRIILDGEVGKTARHIWVDEKTELLLVREHQKLRAFQSLCPHMGAQLQWDGKKKQVNCPWHGLAFCSKTLKSEHHLYKKIREFDTRLTKNVLEIFDV